MSSRLYFGALVLTIFTISIGFSNVNNAEKTCAHRTQCGLTLIMFFFSLIAEKSTLGRRRYVFWGFVFIHFNVLEILGCMCRTCRFVT